MADTTPIHNKNIVDLAQIIEDPLSGADNGVKAASDGMVYSSVYREQKMSDAYAWILKKYRQVYGADRTKDILPGSVRSSALDFTGALSLPTDWLFTYDLIVLTDSHRYVQIAPAETLIDSDPFKDYVFVIFTGTIVVYKRISGVLTAKSTGSGALYYAKAERINSTTGALLAANTAPDLALDLQVHPACVHYAAALIFEAVGDDIMRAKAQVEMGVVKSLLPKEVADAL